ncbi:MAG: tungstate ABC transporter substrate-binding protein WtpA [Desulfobulbaceae bacterium]|nr:tungstate ABC transporter substrate-binding protein WtpA [Desulfobulbaceae bacterium]
MKQNGVLRFGKLTLITIIILFGTQAFGGVSGKVIIFHDSSLSLPFKHLEMAVETKYSKLDIHLEAAGCRKITDEKRACDIIASADYKVIDNLLIPEYADWYVCFASNQMVLCYTDQSAHAKEIKTDNWHDILLKKDITWGHTDPNIDPTGYRALMVVQLAEKHLNLPGLMDRLIANRSAKNIFASASQMVSVLQDDKLDYCWEYSSVAVQHGLKYIVLPDEINLGNYKFDSNYKQASVKVTGKTRGSFMELRGKCITYGVTMLKDAPNKEGAIAFLQCLFTRNGGLMVLKSMGQSPFVPCRIPTAEMKSFLPSKLQQMVEIKQ